MKMISYWGVSAYADGPSLPQNTISVESTVESSRRILIPSMRWKPRARVVILCKNIPMTPFGVVPSHVYLHTTHSTSSLE